MNHHTFCSKVSVLEYLFIQAFVRPKGRFSCHPLKLIYWYWNDSTDWRQPCTSHCLLCPGGRGNFHSVFITIPSQRSPRNVWVWPVSCWLTETGAVHWLECAAWKSTQWVLVGVGLGGLNAPNCINLHPTIDQLSTRQIYYMIQKWSVDKNQNSMSCKCQVKIWVQ